jgi:hypothetical protein
MVVSSEIAEIVTFKFGPTTEEFTLVLLGSTTTTSF